MVKTRSSLLLILALLALAGCAKDPPSQANLRNHRNAAAGYALNLPQGWSVIEATDSKETFTLPLPAAPGSAAASGKLVVTVLVERRPKVDSLQEYLRSSRQQFSATPGYTEVRAEVLRHPNGQEAYLIDAWTAASAQGSAAVALGDDAKRRFKQYGFLLGGKQYLITAVVPAADADRWLREVEPLLNSLLIW